MTKKIDEKSETKQRMRRFLRDNDIDLSEAERKCGFNRGYLSAGGVVGSDKIALFIEAYPNADLYWLVTGKHDKERERYELFVQKLTYLVTDLVTRGKKHL